MFKVRNKDTGLVLLSLLLTLKRFHTVLVFLLLTCKQVNVEWEAKFIFWSSQVMIVIVKMNESFGAPTTSYRTNILFLVL